MIPEHEPPLPTMRQVVEGLAFCAFAWVLVLLIYTVGSWVVA